jgi:hypothetical protein
MDPGAGMGQAPTVRPIRVGGIDPPGSFDPGEALPCDLPVPPKVAPATSVDLAQIQGLRTNMPVITAPLTL